MEECDSTKQKTETRTIDESLISIQKSPSNSFLLFFTLLPSSVSVYTLFSCRLLFTLPGFSRFALCQMSVLAFSNSPSVTFCFFLLVISLMRFQSHLFSPNVVLHTLILPSLLVRRDDTTSSAVGWIYLSGSLLRVHVEGDLNL